MSAVSTVVICLLIFFALNIIVLIKFHKSQNTFEAYCVGNRNFGLALFIVAYIGHWIVGAIYLSWFNTAANIGIFSQYLLIYTMASLVVLYFMAKPIWLWGKRYELETQSDLIALRFGSKRFQIVFSVLTFFFWFPWLILEMRVIGYTLYIATNSLINFNMGMVIVCMFVIIYTFYGGVRGSVIGSTVQVSFFILGGVVIGFLIWTVYGGLPNMFDTVNKIKPELLTLPAGYYGPFWASAIITSTLGAFCLPGMFRLLYIADSYKTIQKTACISPFIVLPHSLLILILALGGISLVGFPATQEASYFWLVSTYGGNLALGLLAAAALSASMSTMSAVINTSANIIAKDWIGNFGGKRTRTQLLRYAKGATIAVGIISLYLASIEIPNLLQIALYMYDCIVQAFVPLFVGLYWKRSNLKGASYGMIVGILIATLGNLMPYTMLWTNGWSAGTIGLMANSMIHIYCGLHWGEQPHVQELFSTLEHTD